MLTIQSLPDLIRALLHVVTCMYEDTGLMYPITHTDRYLDFRPADALLLQMCTVAFVLIGIPIAIVLWAGGVLSLGYLGLAAVVLFLLPPALAMSFMEIVLLCQRLKRP